MFRTIKRKNNDDVIQAVKAIQLIFESFKEYEFPS